MVFVPGGRFERGCDPKQVFNCILDEIPLHTVTLPSFNIGKYEVTQAQWKEVMRTEHPSFKNCAQCPVERVSWNDAQEFIKELNRLTNKNYRLPTEAEWEYAARGGPKSQSFRYAGSDKLDEVAWYRDNSKNTYPVGQKQPNELGIYDMSGNVWEWCQDAWYGNYNGVPINGDAMISNITNMKVLRGGSCNGNDDDCRSANRYRYDMNLRSDFIGFRLVKD